MKLVCVKDSIEETKGFFKPKTINVKVQGLTNGKTYSGTAISVPHGDGNVGFGSINTNIYFLVFDDNGNWEQYELELFRPEE